MIGLVLEGGGAKGAYQIGAYRALKELGIEIDAAVGTSIGAVNAAIIVQGDGDKAWDIWSNIRSSSLFDIDYDIEEELRKDGVTLKNIGYLASKFGQIVKQGGVDTSHMMEFLKEHISERAIRESEMDFGLVTGSLTSMKPLELMKEDIPEGEMLRYIVASATFPVFKAQKIDGKRLVDGGLWNNVPVSLLLDRGYEMLIVVRTHSIGKQRKVVDSGETIIEIAPTDKLGAVLDFNEDTARHDLNLGYYDTLKLFKEFRGTFYYIKPHPDGSWFFNKIARTDPDRIRKLADLLGIDDPMPPKRLLFEKIIPRLASTFNMKSGMDYEDLVLAIYEVVARSAEMEQFRIYDSEEFISKVELFRAEKHEFPKWVPNFVKTSPQLSKLIRTDILNALLEIIFS